MSSRLTKIILILVCILFTACSSTPAPTGLVPPQTFAEKDSKFIEIDGINIHYKEYGSGDTVLFMLHGMLGNVSSWNSITPELSKDYRIVAYDRLAFGLTERPKVETELNPYSPQQIEERALKLMDELEIEKPVLVGHSAGGNMALRLAISHPESFSGLILISPGIYTEIPPGMIRELMQIGMFKKLGIDVIRSIPKYIDQLLSETYYNSEMITEELKENYLIPIRTKNWDWALWEYTRTQDDSMIAEHLSEIELPVLIIQGRDDKIVPPKDNFKASGILPNARLLFLENCGHVAQEEKPLETVKAIRNFLNSYSF